MVLSTANRSFYCCGIGISSGKSWKNMTGFEFPKNSKFNLKPFLITPNSSTACNMTLLEIIGANQS